MIKSMTGFGRGEYADENRKFTVEIKSVNHRYLDVNIKMPKKLNFFESSIRTLLKEYTQRGKIDIYITYEDFTVTNYAINYNKALAEEYFKYLKLIFSGVCLSSMFIAVSIFSILFRTPELFVFTLSVRIAL